MIETMMNYAGFDFSYFLSPKHLIKMVRNFAGFKSEDILDNINDKNFSNFTMVSWMEVHSCPIVLSSTRKGPKKNFEFILKMKR